MEKRRQSYSAQMRIRVIILQLMLILSLLRDDAFLQERLRKIVLSLQQGKNASSCIQLLTHAFSIRL